MSSKYKTVINISSRVENPRERRGSDPLAEGPAARARKNSSPSSRKHVSPHACSTARPTCNSMRLRVEQCS